jgi:hypothetical protein
LPALRSSPPIVQACSLTGLATCLTSVAHPSTRGSTVETRDHERGDPSAQPHAVSCGDRTPRAAHRPLAMVRMARAMEPPGGVAPEALVGTLRARPSGRYPPRRMFLRRPAGSRGDAAQPRGVTHAVRFRVAARRADAEVRDVGEAPSVAGPGPEASARETGADATGPAPVTDEEMAQPVRDSWGLYDDLARHGLFPCPPGVHGRAGVSGQGTTSPHRPRGDPSG